MKGQSLSLVYPCNGVNALLCRLLFNLFGCCPVRSSVVAQQQILFLSGQKHHGILFPSYPVALQSREPTASSSVEYEASAPFHDVFCSIQPLANTTCRVMAAGQGTVLCSAFKLACMLYHT